MHDIVYQKLIADLHYSTHAAMQTAADLLRIEHTDIKEATNRWVNHDELMPVAEGSFSTDILMYQYDMTYPAALIFLDWYREDSVTALTALATRM